jgi:hypothetical protein
VIWWVPFAVVAAVPALIAAFVVIAGIAAHRN